MVERIARRFRALGEPQRLRILQVLEQGATSFPRSTATNPTSPVICRGFMRSVCCTAGAKATAFITRSAIPSSTSPSAPGKSRKNSQLKEGAMEVLVENLGAMQFDIEARQHSLVCDQPQDNRGFDEGMTPPEFLLAALGFCAAFCTAQCLRK